MLEVILAAILASPAAPAPAPRVVVQAQFRPGVYEMKWAGSRWGSVLFEEGGFYGYNYTVRPSKYNPLPEIMRYEGRWRWDPKTRVLEIREAFGQYREGRDLNRYEFKFGSKLDVGASHYVKIHLRPVR